MCGIVGIVGQWLPGVVERMNQVQRHRGPDGAGVYQDCERRVAVGHTRLAILDTSDAASQPMRTDDGRFVLVYNGELYNFWELRRELEIVGKQFRSTGDTEVVLKGMEREGPDFLGRMNGIFALALWDMKDRSLLLARDAFGVKPLYYSVLAGGALVFASELKAILAHPHMRRQPNVVALLQHLAYSHSSGQGTAVKDVLRLPQGRFLLWNGSRPGVSIRPYGGDSSLAELPYDFTPAAEDLRDTVKVAVRRQMVSDVRVGSFLSGGLDSSLVTAVASADRPEDFACFTTYYPGSENRLDAAAADLPHARRVANGLDLPLHEIELRPDVAELWPKLIWHLDEPIADPAAIAAYLISRLASEHGHKVLLSGQGADEVFLGYPRYLAVHNSEWLDRLPLWLRGATASLATRLPGAREGRVGATLRRVRRTLSIADQPPMMRFLSLCGNTPVAEIDAILSDDFRDALRGESYADECAAYMESTGLKGMCAMRQRDMNIYLPNHNLLYTDKMGMAAGVEVRVPFLDPDVVRKALAYPLSWLISGRRTKIVLKKASRGMVPDAVIDRPKAGFGAPYRKWLRYDLAELWHELTDEESVRARGWFDYNALQAARARSQAGQADLYMLQWVVLTIELWARKFLDKSTV